MGGGVVAVVRVCVYVRGYHNSSHHHLPSPWPRHTTPRTHRLGRRRQGGLGGGVGAREEVPNEEELLVGIGSHGGERLGRGCHGLCWRVLMMVLMNE